MPVLWDVLPICTIYYLHQINFKPKQTIAIPDELFYDEERDRLSNQFSDNLMEEDMMQSSQGCNSTDLD